MSVIIRLYANRGGWIAALEDAGLRESPRDTIRIFVRTTLDAAKLASALRTCGHTAAHSGHRTWVEFRGTLAEAGAALTKLPMATAVEALWHPRRRRAPTG